MRDTIDDPPEFTEEQLRAALKQVGEEARQRAFAAGRPIMIAKDQRLVLVHPDGREEDAGPLSRGKGPPHGEP